MMSLPMDTPPGIADALGYLQYHLQELTKWQNALEHAINTTLAALTAQIQQITQLMTNSAPIPTVALPPIPIFPSLVRPPFSTLATLSEQQARPKLPSPPDFSSKWSSRQAFLNSYMLYLRLALEQFTCDKKKSSGPSPSLRMDMLQSGLRTSFARRRTLASSQFNPGLTLNNNSRVNSFQSM